VRFGKSKISRYIYCFKGYYKGCSQMKFLRHLFGITKLDKEKNQCIKEKTGAQNKIKEMK